jgi:hypothetical protein
MTQHVTVDIGEGLVDAKVIPIQHIHGYVEIQFQRKEERRLMYVHRRRAWLWRPLAALGAVLLVAQITANVPVPALVFIGIGMCLPWVADV